MHIQTLFLGLRQRMKAILANSGPPDLEELWRDANRRLSTLFGKRTESQAGNRNGGPTEPPTPMSPRVFGSGIGIVVGILLIVWLGSGFYIVDASQRGVVLQFGRYHETTPPGLQWRLPYPIQSHEIVSLTDVRTIEVGYRGSERNKYLKEALMLTDDENIVNIQFAVQYVLKDPESYIFYNRYDQSDASDTVRGVAEAAIREIVGKSKMDFVLYEGREQIAANAAALIQSILDRYRTGIQVSKVTMQNAQPPEQVQAAFDDAVKAGQDRERQKNEGQAYANDVIPRARGTASRLIEEATGYRTRIVNVATGEADRFKLLLKEYDKAPEVTRSRMYIDTLQQIMSSTNKVMIDAKGNGNLLYLPLDKLMQSTAPATAGTGSSGTGETPGSTARQPDSAAAAGKPEPPAADYRSRDSFRSRERGER
ncbi:MAG: hypothetical protein AMXMBFR6_11010 [Betaproteobacteria bacterium]